MKFKVGDVAYFFEKREDVKDIEQECTIESIGWDPNDVLYMVSIPNFETGGKSIVPKFESDLMTIDELLKMPV